MGAKTSIGNLSKSSKEFVCHVRINDNHSVVSEEACYRERHEGGVAVADYDAWGILTHSCLYQMNVTPTV